MAMTHTLVSLVRNILGMSLDCDGASSLPTLLIGRAGHSKLSGFPAAEKAMAYFNVAGFDCDRTKMNLYGYPGLLRDLSSPPPWVHVEMEDVVSEVSSERRTELRQLFDYIHDTDTTQIDNLFLTGRKNQLTAIFRNEKPLLSQDTSLLVEAEAYTSFARLARLGELITPAQFAGIYDAVFPFDEFLLSPGIPDLLVWLPKSSPSCWFFAEVKAHGDYLSQSQKAWLRNNWDVVRGHYLLALLE